MPRLFIPFVVLAWATLMPNVLTAQWATAQTDGVTAAEINQKMRVGFNLGNTFDSHQNSTALKDIRPLIDFYRSAGMRHVRIPVTWVGTIADRQGQINFDHPRFRQLQAAVDYALAQDLIVIINTHHEHWLKDNYDGSESFDNAFYALWKGIAEKFKDYSPNLVFEILNEPEKAFGDWSGPIRPTNPQALAFTRRINENGWKAIRETGGPNKTRVVMVGTNGQGNQSMLPAVYPTAASLPGSGQDRSLMITVHTYDPWDFCGQDGSNQNAPAIAAIKEPIRKVAAHSRQLGVPVNYGEFGVGRNRRPDERDTDLVRNYYQTVKTTALAEGMSVTPWDDQGWFGLTSRNVNGEYHFVYDIVPTMLRE
jgi:endoglucanase